MTDCKNCLAWMINPTNQALLYLGKAVSKEKRGMGFIIIAFIQFQIVEKVACNAWLIPVWKKKSYLKVHINLTY